MANPHDVVPVEETDRLATLIARKHQCLVEIHHFGERQAALVQSDDIPALMSLLAHKQKALGRLQQTENALAPFREQDPSRRTWRSEALRQACADTIRKCEALLARIMEQDASSTGELEKRRDDIHQRIQGMHATQHARAAYLAPDAAPVSGQLDLMSEE